MTDHSNIAMPNHLNLAERLRIACNGNPHAKIGWPHYILHEAADEIDRLQKVEAAQLCFMCSERVDRQCSPPMNTLDEVISAAIKDNVTSVKAARMLVLEIEHLHFVIDNWKALYSRLASGDEDVIDDGRDAGII